MSILILDHTQRLNLHALIGMQRATLDDMRMFWRLQDRLELSPDEKLAIGYQVQQVNGQQQVSWNPMSGLAPREFEFSQEEHQKLAHVLKTWQQGYLIADARIWLEPLLGQLENGSAPQ